VEGLGWGKFFPIGYGANLRAVPCAPHNGRGLFGFYVRQERGDDERDEELDVVIQVSCVLYILSDEGYQRELVSDSWVGTKDIQVVVVRDARCKVQGAIRASEKNRIKELTWSTIQTQYLLNVIFEVTILTHLYILKII
jgi:hypothetical protein